MFDVPSCSCHIPSLPQYLNNPHVRPLARHLQTPRRRAQCRAILLQPLGLLRRWDANGAPQRVRMARQGFGGGVHHSIYTQQQRPLQGWWCKPREIENDRNREVMGIQFDVVGSRP